MGIEEPRLVTLAQKGDVAAFEALVEQHQGMVYNLAYRLVGDREEASDLAQEALLRAYRALGTFQGNASFRTWLYRIANNVCLDHLRKKTPTSVSIDNPVDTDEGEVQRELPSGAPGPEEQAERLELREVIQRELSALEPDYRQAVVLRDVMGYSYEEIAGMLGVAPGTVKSRIHRGRLQLRERFLALELFPAARVQREERGAKDAAR